MIKRLKAGGISLGILILFLISGGGIFAAMWFLGDWLYTTPVWWLGIPVRIFQWIVAFAIFVFLVYWVYGFIKSLVTGKPIGD